MPAMSGSSPPTAGPRCFFSSARWARRSALAACFSFFWASRRRLLTEGRVCPATGSFCTFRGGVVNERWGRGGGGGGTTDNDDGQRRRTEILRSLAHPSRTACAQGRVRAGAASPGRLG